jgi:hypothetical protein
MSILRCGQSLGTLGAFLNYKDQWSVPAAATIPPQEQNEEQTQL